MPSERILKIAPDNTLRQFEYYLYKNQAPNGKAKHEPLAPDGHELLYRRNCEGDGGASLEFKPRSKLWAYRQYKRLQVRYEVKKLIDAQFGDQALIVKRRFLPNETIGDRIMKDSATPSGFSFNRINDAALEKIGRRIAAVRDTIAKHNKKHPHEEANGEKKPFLVSKEMLDTIYLSADEDVAVVVNQGKEAFALSQDHRRGLHERERDRDQGAYYLALAAQKNNEDARDEMQDTAKTGDRRFMKALARVYLEGRGDIEQDLSKAAFWLARSWQGLKAAHDHTDWATALYAEDDAVPDLPAGALELELSNTLVTGNMGIDAIPEKAAYLLFLAAGKGNSQAKEKMAKLSAARSAEGNDPDLQIAFYELYREGWGDIKPDMRRAALWLARAIDEQIYPPGAGADNSGRRSTLSWLKAHIDDNDLAPMLFELSKVYRAGRLDVPPDPYKAAYFNALSARRGAMEFGNEDPMDDLREPGRRKNDQAIQYALSELYRKGDDGIAPDYKSMQNWLLQAMGARPNDRDFNFEQSYDNHLDERRKPWKKLPQAVKDAATKTGPGAREFALFKAYRDGAGGVERDMVAAAFWLWEASWEDTNASAQLSWQDCKRYLPQVFQNTKGANADEAYWEAIRLKCDLAIKSTNDPEVFYERAQGWREEGYTSGPVHQIQPRPDLYARDLWTAAQNRLPKAQFELAQLYKQGTNRTERDDVEYAHWLIRAAASGHEEARGELLKLKNKRPDSAADRDPVAARMQYCVGQLFTHGRNDLGRAVIDQNLEEAKAFTQAAVENGYGASADTALEALYARGLPPRTAPEDFKRPVPAPPVGSKSASRAGPPPSCVPAYRLKLMSDIEAMKLREKMIRDKNPFADGISKELDEWLRYRQVNYYPKELMETFFAAHNAMIELMTDMEETGRLSLELLQNYKRLEKVHDNEWRRNNEPTTMGKVFSDDKTARQAQSNGQRYDEAHIIPEYIRPEVEDFESRMSIMENMMATTRDNWLHYAIEPRDPSLFGTLAHLQQDFTSKYGKDSEYERFTGVQVRDRGLWRIAEELGLVDEIGEPWERLQ